MSSESWHPGLQILTIRPLRVSFNLLRNSLGKNIEIKISESEDAAPLTHTMENDDLRHQMVKDGAKIRIFHEIAKKYLKKVDYIL